MTDKLVTSVDPDVDISVPDLMDVIDRYVDLSQPTAIRRELRASIERMLTQEKRARRLLEAQLNATHGRQCGRPEPHAPHQWPDIYQGGVYLCTGF